MITRCRKGFVERQIKNRVEQRLRSLWRSRV